jgi:hypothetical protein
MASAALPTVVPFKERDLSATATGAFDAIRPTTRNNVLAAANRIIEVEDCFMKRFGLAAHVSVLRQAV